MPTHTTFPAMFEGRCHSAIHATNYGSAESLARLCDGMGCSISPGSSVAKAIQTEQHNYQGWKSYNKSERNVLAKACKRQELFDLYKKLQGDIQYLGPSINGLVTDGNTKLCCRGFILALVQSSTANKIDSEHTRRYKRLLPVCEAEILRVTLKRIEAFSHFFMLISDEFRLKVPKIAKKGT